MVNYRSLGIGEAEKEGEKKRKGREKGIRECFRLESISSVLAVTENLGMDLYLESALKGAEWAFWWLETKGKRTY